MAEPNAQNTSSNNFVIKKHRRKTRERKPAPTLDLNPMSDLAFQLIIFFMLATTFSRPQTMEIVMPVKPKGNEKEQAVKESKALTLLLYNDDKIYYYQGITDPEVMETNYTTSGLRQLVLDKNKEIYDLVILIKPHKSSNYQNLIDVLDEMTIAHNGRYAIVEITSDDEELVKNYLAAK
ncbi:MAG: ExbD/TolR family protein [Bacteroidia bacterium]